MKKRFSKNTKLGGLWLKSFVKKDKRKYPLISIIMPNYKSTNLEKSIKSVLNQTYKNVELILVDGDSGKKTIKILKKYNNKIDFWLSEKDKGMWDAWNKGLKLSRGRFVGIVDSTNKLYPDAMKILSSYIKKDQNFDFISGTVKKDGRVYGGFNPEKITIKFNIITSSVVGFFIKRSSLKKVGYLNLKYKIQADYDLLYRMIVKHNLKGINSSGKEVFGDLGESGFSKKHNFWETLFNEIIIRNDNGQNKLVLLYIIVGRCLRKFFNILF
jgi:glycosyltransferase involved in cell wall biosynthesis